MDNQNIIKTEYSEIMQKSFIDYAMSVIVSRALPDVRDGLKPVQRRTLYDMYELGIRYDKPTRKCARIVGDTMGKYHPHGDASIYDTLVVMAQDFKKEIPLVEGQGNFGSIEGDCAAAMRYTEARLPKITQEAFLADLDKDVVDFVPNFDETEKEPSVLPARIPNLLVNGAEGIAVGMATSIPTHNLTEIIDGVIAYINNEKITTEELMESIKGPDFPTGGIVANKSELLSIYETGIGKLRLRGRVEVEKLKGGKSNLVITEIPYTMIGANIGKFLTDVANLVETRKTTDIVDISNHSDKNGIRIVLELKKNADTENLLNLLYKKTRLEDTFGVNMLAVVDGRPETMGLKEIIKHHVDFQFAINTRKFTTLLNKELEKKEIQEGLIKACDVIDLIIEILRGSKNIQDARACLIHGETANIKFKSKESEKLARELHFTEAQAKAILEMRLYKLIGLEIHALLADHEKTLKNISLFETILKSKKAMSKVIIKELEQYKKEFGSPRKTSLEDAKEVVVAAPKIEEQEVVFLMDRFGYAKTIDPGVYERNKDAADAENKYIFTCMNTDKICIFTDTGKMHTLKVLDLPAGKFRGKGTPIDNVCNYDSSVENMVGIFSLNEIKNKKLIFATQCALLKQVDGLEFDVAKRTIAATKLNDEDLVIKVDTIENAEHLVLQTENGFFLRFAVEEVPEKKKGAAGVRGIRLQSKDKLEQLHLLNDKTNPTVTYKEKEIDLRRLKIGKRDNTGVKTRL